MRRFIIFLLVMTFLWACSSDDDVISQESLNEQWLKIVALSESEVCNDISEWRIVGTGAKPCGGPTGYIAYSVNINMEEFLELVEKFNQDSRAFADQEGLISNCMVTSPPAGMKCEDGKAVLLNSPCELVPHRGPCEAAITAFYFDKVEQRCKEFIWGGCEGVVPFETLELCQLCE